MLTLLEPFLGVFPTQNEQVDKDARVTKDVTLMSLMTSNRFHPRPFLPLTAPNH